MATARISTTTKAATSRDHRKVLRTVTITNCNILPKDINNRLMDNNNKATVSHSRWLTCFGIDADLISGAPPPGNEYGGGQPYGQSQGQYGGPPQQVMPSF